MSFFSTRGGACATASQAILRGLAQDGGLFVPSMFPQITLERLSALSGTSYQNHAERILRSFLEDYSIAEIDEAVQAAYNPAVWDDHTIAPVKTLEPGLHVLELFHGPTLAFKDIALQILPHLTRMAAEKNDEKREICILAATSGDTGKAALEGFKDVPGTSCTVFYPKDGVSDVQKLQMVTTEGGNTHVIGVDGNFDDAQRGVKQLFSNPDFRKEMESKGKLLSSANSINFGRLAPQIVYYFTTYTRLVKRGELRMGQHINFVVPTGNFGDILAGYYAKCMGLPIHRLICASNANTVLADFFDGGTYDADRELVKTTSPSMDILFSSNLERLLYEYADRDPVQVKEWMAQLNEEKIFSIGIKRSKELKKIFWADYADDDMTAAEIRRVFDRNEYLMDPHTAVASHVLHQYRLQTGDQTAAVIVSTASPYKFAPAVAAALLGEDAVEDLDFFACAKRIEKLTGVRIPKQIHELRNQPIRHTAACAPDAMEAAVLDALK